MDEIDDFFKSPGPSNFVRLPSPVSHQTGPWEEPPTAAPPRRSALGTLYAEQIARDERTAEPFCDEDEDEDEAMDTEAEEDEEEDNLRTQTQLVYAKYDFSNCRDRGLPIDDVKDMILESIRTQQVTIIEGHTGCGKTTQIPQWILKDCYERRAHCNIVVTQPRRIAAVGVTKRVASEYGCNPGELIGYQIGLEKVVSPDTRLQYVTTGVLLRQIRSSKSLSNFTHIILDEVHEREKDMDFLLIIIRKLIKHQCKRIKVVLMSATLEVDQFATYFSKKTYSGFQTCPVISLPNMRGHRVEIYYLEQLKKIKPLPELDFENPNVSKEMLEFTLKLLNALEKIDAIEEASNDSNDRRPCILIFLPGLGEIEDLYSILNSEHKRKKIDPSSPLHKWWLIPLHSTITTEEQIRVFQKPPTGCRKIILTTNIAESSITVPDTKYVIDFCLTKLDICSNETNFSSLKLCWASRTNCIQRAGRAGRVRSGKVYRLIPSHFYDMFSKECTPEMQRSNLENLILQAKLLDMGPPKTILALAMDPPDLSNIHRTILVLKEVGALYKTLSGKYSEENGDITYLGIVMGMLPLDIRVSKMILLGNIFGCLEECIIIGAALSTKNLFSTPFLEKLSAYSSKLTWAYGSFSDCIAFYNVYKVYTSMLKRNKFSNNREIKTWANSMYLQLKSLRELDKLVKEIRTRLKNEKIISERHTNIWNRVDLPLILKMIIAGAFYPNYFCFSNLIESDGREANKILNGRDPFNTIYLTNMDNRQPGSLYTSQIKKIFEGDSTTETHVEFDSNSEKIFVTFPSPLHVAEDKKIPGKVPLSVFKAIKMRTLRVPITLNVMPLDSALKKASDLGICTSSGKEIKNDRDGRNLHLSSLTRLPGIDESFILLTVTNIITCGHFWARIDDASTRNELQWIYNNLNQNDLAPLKDRPVVGRMYAVLHKFIDTPCYSYYRGKVKKIVDNIVHIFLIDFGIETHAPFNKLKEFGVHQLNLMETQPLAFECVLSEISPSLVKDSIGTWTQEATRRFQELVYKKTLHGKIYSIAFSVVALELIDNGVNINEILLAEGYAQIAEESYASKLNRDLRDRVNEMSPREITIHNNQQALQNVTKLSETFMPNANECTEKITLRGPFSPLETKIHSMFHSMLWKNIHIDWDSVNSVMLKTDFHTENESLLVASVINESTNGNSYTLRNTTLMPNIPGLNAIIAMLFCPTGELRCDAFYSCYVSFLCGLGHINGESIFPEHDLVVNINVELSKTDIENINYLRHILSQMLLAEENKPANITHNLLKNNVSCDMKNIIKKLLSVRRRYHNFTSGGDDRKWNSIDPNKEVKFQEMGGCHDLYPPISGIEIDSDNRERKLKLARSNYELRRACHNSSSLKDLNATMECELCGTGMQNLQSLRLHLHSRLHRDRESDLPPPPNPY